MKYRFTLSEVLDMACDRMLKEIDRDAYDKSAAGEATYKLHHEIQVTGNLSGKIEVFIDSRPEQIPLNFDS